MSVLTRPIGDDVAISYGNDYFSLSQVKEIVVGQRFEVLCRDGRHYRAEVKQFDPVSGVGVLHFCHWSTAYDYKGSLNDIYISPDGLYSNGQLTKLNTYPSESNRNRRRASASSYSAEHRASKAFLESTRYPDDFLSKPRFTFRLKAGAGDDLRSDSGESAATSAKKRRRASVPSMPAGSSSSSSDNIPNGSGIGLDNSADDLPKHALFLALAESTPPQPSSPSPPPALHKQLDVIPESVAQSVVAAASSAITEQAVAAAVSPEEEVAEAVRPADDGRTAARSSSASLIIPLGGHSAKAEATPSFPSHLIAILQSLQLPDSLARLRDALPHSLLEEKSEGNLYSAGNVMKLLQVRQYLDDVLLRILNHHLAAESQNTNTNHSNSNSR